MASTRVRAVPIESSRLARLAPCFDPYLDHAVRPPAWAAFSRRDIGTQFMRRDCRRRTPDSRPEDIDVVDRVSSSLHDASGPSAGELSVPGM